VASRIRDPAGSQGDEGHGARGLHGCHDVEGRDVARPGSTRLRWKIPRGGGRPVGDRLLRRRLCGRGSRVEDGDQETDRQEARISQFHRPSPAASAEPPLISKIENGTRKATGRRLIAAPGLDGDPAIAPAVPIGRPFGNTNHGSGPAGGGRHAARWTWRRLPRYFAEIRYTVPLESETTYRALSGPVTMLVPIPKFFPAMRLVLSPSSNL